MRLEKAQMTLGDDTLRITMPLQKIDKEKRTVSGFATLDNIDKHGDVVTKEASSKAFAEFLGNVRLMHQPIPAGKVLNFREEQYLDPATNKVYNGIYVDTYISKGAPEVWEMVLDGTLTGFSIGGNDVVAETEFNKDAGRAVRKVTGYKMHELSLVDNPANQHSNILSIQKSADGVITAEGTLADVSVENVFYCKQDHDPVTLVGAGDAKDCLDCGSPMKNIGWFETDGGDKVQKVNALVADFESTEGGDNMTKSNDKEEAKAPKTKAEEAHEDATQVESAEDVSPKGDAEVIAPEGKESDTAVDVEDANVTVTGTGAVKTEEAAKLNEETKIEEGTVDENPLTKMFEDLHSKIDSAFDKTVSKTSEELATIQANFEKKFVELGEKHAELVENFGTLKGKFDEIEKSLDGLGSTGAIKKSADLGGSEEDSSLQKSDRGVWRGSIFSMGNIS